MRAFGADEAGRGPVLGPMVAAAVLAGLEYLPRGVADSKTLTAANREALATTVAEDGRIAVGVSVVSPARIDDPDTDMNALTVAAQADAIDQVLDNDSEGNGDGSADTAADGETSASIASSRPTGVVDACDVDPERFARRVRESLSVPADLRAEHRADENRPIVAAASVLAKVERDERVANLGEEYREHGPVGSGYPSDRRTREFLQEYVRANGELPACARACWKTSRDVLQAASQSALGEF
jgi:ribonuclease HII